MITSMETGNVQREGVGEETTFKIKASAKAFEILSSGLYKDKIGAVLREYSANAYDSHIAANNNNPFLMHLPNSIEPWFSIRDYGIGLSHEQVTTVFTTYFESLKTESNDFVGCLGLGSKSAYSYTETFAVTSFFNGMKRIYNCFLNEYKIPSCVLLSEEETTEPNGLEIQFSVKEKDCREFVNKTPKILEYFKIKPIILGADIEFNPIVYFIKKDDWGVRGATINKRDWNMARAVMGNIAYPISDFPQEDLTPAEVSILSYDIDINFDIGQLEITASREGLSYDSKTRKCIKERLTKVATEIITEIQERISKCTSLWEARKLIYSLRKGDYSIFAGLIETNQTTFTWNTVTLFNALNGTGTEHIKVNDLYEIVDVKRIRIEGYRKKRGVLDTLSSVPVSDKVLFYIQDNPKHVLRRCMKLMETLNNNMAHVILVSSKQFVDTVTGKVVDGVAEFKKHLGMDDSEGFPLVSALPFDPIAVGVGNGGYNPKNACKILVYDSTGGRTKSHGRNNSYESCWRKDIIDLKAGGIYVAIDRYMINNNSPTPFLCKYFRVLTELGIPTPVIYGVKVSEIEKIKTYSNWQTIAEYAKKHLVEHFAKTNLADSYGYSQQIALYCKSIANYDESYNIISWIKEYGDIFNNISEITYLIDKLNTIKKNTTLFENIVRLMNEINLSNIIDYDIDAIDKIVHTDFDNAINYVKQNFPMLKYMATYRMDDEKWTDITNYVQAMKSKRILQAEQAEQVEKVVSEENSVDKN